LHPRRGAQRRHVATPGDRKLTWVKGVVEGQGCPQLKELQEKAEARIAQLPPKEKEAATQA
jgi:hypothetical protein